MKGNKHMKTITNTTYLAFALCAIACFALSAKAQTNCQEGCDLNGGGTTVLGDAALINNMGSNNTAIGSLTLNNNTFGSDNTAIGAQALEDNDGNNNTAIGVQALQNNGIGNENTATGVDALFYNTSGSSNNAIGNEALLNNTTGNSNTAIGFNALESNSTGSNNIALGVQAGINVSGNNNIDIGNAGVAGESSRIRIGTKPAQKATFIAGISGVTVANGVGVIVNTQGQLGTVVSSARFKEAIKPMDKISEAILGLKPVTFHYKHDLDPEGIPQFGLVAEEVEKVSPALVARDEQGKPYTVRYEAVNAMLLNEFLKEHRKNEKQEATIAELKSTVAQQQKGFAAKLAKQEEQIEALTAGLQRVSAQLEASKPAPQMVNNP